MTPIARFIQSRSGNFAVATALIMLPSALALGVALDFSMASSSRSQSQDALDAAVLAALTMPGNPTEQQRKDTLQKIYETNGGLGTVTMNLLVPSATTGLTLEAKANYKAPTRLMRLAGNDQVNVGVTSAASAPPRLITMEFEVDKGTGWWDKEVTLFSRKRGESNYVAQITIRYEWDQQGDQTGEVKSNHGTTTVSKSNNGVWTPVVRKVCAPTLDQNSDDCVTTTLSDRGKATVDVSEMDDLYLEMTILTDSKSSYVRNEVATKMKAGMPQTIRTSDPLWSQRLFVSKKIQEHGVAVDIFRTVGCGETREQAWEDGGSPGTSNLYGATSYNSTDFRYKVRGTCDLNPSMESARLIR